jgi:hypothetical protein
LLPIARQHLVRLLKEPICGVIRPPHRLGGVARSRSLFVATPPLILYHSGEFMLSLSKEAPCIWAFLTSLEEMDFSTGYKEVNKRWYCEGEKILSCE